jgi:site-specific recombinase XerD
MNMLEYFYDSAVRLRQLRRGPLAGCLDEMAAELRAKGYGFNTARSILGIVGRFNQYLHARGVGDLLSFDVGHVQVFLSELDTEGVFRGAPIAMTHLVAHLRKQGILPEEVSPPREDVCDGLAEKFVAWSQSVRGTSDQTCYGYRKFTERFLQWLVERHDHFAVRDICGVDIVDYIISVSETWGHGSFASSTCSAMRMFLRYLYWERLTEDDFSRTVPRVSRWRLATIPRHLPLDKVRTLIGDVSTASAEGLRDKAVLVTIAYLGLRNFEVRNMQIGHLNWRKGELLVPKTKTARERILPIPHEAGAAIADYLLHGRPAADLPYVFLRHKAPIGRMRTSGSVGAIVESHLRMSGIDAPSRGAHLLRHSLATGMINSGVPIKDIADVLGHASIDTTAIYTKVDTEHLMAAALPFPEGGAQ